MPAATVDHSQRICEVWANNLEEELKRIRHVIRKYNYIAMDTEFPGVVARPIGEFRSNADYQYQLLRLQCGFAQDNPAGPHVYERTRGGFSSRNTRTKASRRLLRGAADDSGVVLCDGVKWLSFHSGYDFGYLIKILSNANLPEEEVDFFEILRLYFPIIYDVKYLMKSCKNLKMFFEDHIDDAKYCGHLYGLGSGSAYVQNGTGNAYEEEANKQQS
ncbi:CCR4-NOT transcription complex subunit 7 [Larimichthys crocea]|uniref:poly(A)-specific ribonuclease n=1 Tax=Larimichthys crocea TaxID=215358 RepID=A0A6G0HDC3_LARCR|nr:CCR4-NOT transcription complex subunit 7 [Larimichthys crocea]